MRIKPFTALAAAALLAGCATPTLRQIAHRQHHILARVHRIPAGVVETTGAYVGHQLVHYDAIRHPVTIHANQTPIGLLVQAAAHAHGDSVFFADGARANKPVTAEIVRARFGSAMRTLAETAGYAAVWRKNRHELVIAPRATYFYRVPTDLLNAGNGAYAVGGNTAASGASSSGASGGGMSGGMGGGMPGGGMPGGSSGASGSSGSSMEAEFTVSGATQAEHVKTLQKSLLALAGNGARVGINAHTGIVSVTADGRGLARTDAFIRRYVRAADTRVQVHTAILEVSLAHGLQWGINWQKIASLSGAASGAAATLGFNNPAPALTATQATTSTGGSSASTTLNYTGASVSSLVTALRTVTDVRVVSEPSLVVENGTPSTLFSGTQLPYVGSISSNVTGLSGSASTGAGLSYALNGLSLSVIPDVLSDRYVTLTVVPALSEINRFDTFDVNGTQLQGPVQDLRQTYIQTLVPSGKTLIIGGSRQLSSTKQNTATPGLGQIPWFGTLFKGIADQGKVEQLVILVRATVLPPPHYDPLIGSSL
ncbi:MAG: type II secretion system protein GspD [Acidiferrobacter sp.]